MAYTIQPNAVLEIQILGRLHGQRTRNVFHYWYRGMNVITDGRAEVISVMTDFQNTVASPMLALLSEEFTIEHIQGQWIDPVRYRAALNPMNASGGIAVSACPTGVAVVVRRQAERAGHHYQGRVYIPGLPTSVEEDSTVEVGSRAAWNAWAAAFMTKLTGAEGGQNYSMVVSVDVVVTSEDLVAQVSLDPILRYQRRREIGVGE